MGIAFISPAAPRKASRPPTGGNWVHEVKHDGFRVQLHLHRGDVTVYSRHGADFTRRCAQLVPVLSSLSVRSAIIDAELVACGSDGLPSFSALMYRAKSATLCIWCFDLLALDGRQLVERPLEHRRERLARILDGAGSQVRYSEAFADGEALLAACEAHRLEGIVSKRLAAPYRSGERCGWLKIKTHAWREANRSRWELFAVT